MKHIVLTGGGTAGHVTPNIALIPKLQEKGFQISYIGSYNGIEKSLIQELGIPYYVMNFKREFKEQVMDYFIGEYRLGRTPNPCIACNRHVKWEALLKRSLDIGADYIATGHYARIEQLANGRYAIKNSVTAKKDQT